MSAFCHGNQLPEKLQQAIPYGRQRINDDGQNRDR
jgi:hypothetical protein